jgi:voltage-gated potassium channel
MSIVNNSVFERGITVIIILNLVAMVLESEPSVSTDLKHFLVQFEYFSIAIFTIEYLLRTFHAFKKKIQYNSTFFGVIDLLAFLPFFIQALINFDGRFIRIFRLFRVTRIIKLGRFSRSFELLGKCISNVRRELYVTFYIALVILFFSATGIYYLENPVQPNNFSSIMESFWWAVASLTGVGFEEIYPITTGGKVFGTIISMIGVGVVAVPTGIISGSFVEIINDESMVKKN